MATQKVDLSSAPAATSGRGDESGSGEGANPRERRTGKLRRTTESSQRRWIGRSCVRNASAIPAEPAAGLVVLEGDRLVGEVPARHHERPAEVAVEQVVERRVREHHAEPRRPGCDGLGDEGSRHAAEQDDRALPRLGAA